MGVNSKSLQYILKFIMSNQIKLLIVKGCHNCEIAKQTLEKHGFIFDIVDCDTDLEAIPKTLDNDKISLPLLRVQDNYFIIGGNISYLEEIIRQILKI